MKIGLLACYPKSYRDPFTAFLALASLENLLRAEGHVPTVFPAVTDPSAMDGMDKLILLGSPFDDPHSPWTQWLTSLRTDLVDKIVLMGVHGFQAGRVVDEHQAIFARIAKNHPIAVCDRASREQMIEITSSRAAVMTGMPAYWAEGHALRLRKKTRLLMPAFIDPKFGPHSRAYAALMRGLHRRWNQAAPVLYAGMHSDCLDLAAPGGEATFFQPSAPSLLLHALVSADAVLSGHATQLQVAVQNGVAGILLGNDAVEKAMAEGLGIPYLELHSNSQPAELAHRAEELLSRYPWDTAKQKHATLVEKTLEFLGEAGLVKKGSATKKKSAALVGERHWATVASDKNLHTVLGWVENIVSVYPGRNQFHILCASRGVEASLEASMRAGSWTSYPLKVLWNEDAWQSCRRFPQAQLLAASKPKFLLKVLEQTKNEVFYSDADVVFFRDPSELILENNTCAKLVARFADSTHDCARNGIYSASLFSVQPSAEPFLNWWASFTLQPRSAGMRVDGFLETKLLDSAPLLFPSIQVIREPGVLSESGNIESTSVERHRWPGDVLTGFHGGKIAAFRSVGIDRLGAHEIKTGWDQLASVFIQTKKVIEQPALRHSIWVQQRLHWPRLDNFFCAKEWLESHVPLLAHPATNREVRFFTFGLGRALVRLVTFLGFAAPPHGAARAVTRASDPINQLWKSWQQTVLRRVPEADPTSNRHTQVA